MTPPRLARLLLALALPASERRVLLGDLDEEFRREILPERGPHRARAWYWRQALGSLPHAIGLRAWPALRQIPGDLRYALRLWRKRPAFAAAAILTQAVGIAVATAVVAVAYAILLKPLPYPDTARVVQIFEGTARPGLLSHQDFLDLRRANRSFEQVAGFSGGSRTLLAPGAPPERLATIEVTDGFFEVLGVPPLTGRAFGRADVVRGAPPVVILSHAAWLRRFGGDSATLGRTLVLNGQPHTVVGILPRDFIFPLRGLAEVWLPLRPSPQQEERGYWHWMDVIGRVKRDLPPAQVAADLQSVAAMFAARDAKWHGSASLHTEGLRDVLVGGVRPTLHALLAGSALALVATCATIAGLLLSRATARAREFSVRTAIGASRGRLARQLVTETLLLSLAGGLLGVAAAHWILRGFLALVPRSQIASLPHLEAVGVDAIAAGAAVLLVLVTGLLFGVAPAVRAGRDGSAGLAGARTTAGAADTRLRFALVSAQVAVAFVLLSGAALLGTSVYRLLQVSPGFDPDGIVTMRLTLGPTYADERAVQAFNARLLERIGALPGVLAAAAVSQAPLTGRGDTGSPAIVERPRPAGEPAPEAGLRTVSATYFEAMRIPVIRGRGFLEADGARAPLVVVVNQLLADRLFAGADPLGQHLTFEFAPEPREIVGIVGNEQLDDLDRPRQPVVYFPAGQDAMRAFTLLVRTSRPDSLAADVKAAVSQLDPALPVFAVRSMEQIATDSPAVFLRRAAMSMLALFAAAALLLAAVALYGILAQSVAERTREIGVRAALGATRGDVFALVLRRGLLTAAVGLGAGAAAALAVGRLLSSLLFGVRPTDPLMLGACAFLLATIAVLACVLPAARATRIDPATAIRVE